MHKNVTHYQYLFTISIRVVIFVLLVMVVSLASALSLTEYSLFAINIEGNEVIRLRVLSNGQIIDPLQQYTTMNSTRDINYDMTRKYLFISCHGYVTTAKGIATFKINDDGSLLSLGTTTSITGSVYKTVITPNNQLLFSYTSNSSDIFTLSSTGILTDTGNKFESNRLSGIDPLGRIAITPSLSTVIGPCYYVHSINYNSKTLTLTQILPDAGNVSGIRFPKSGNMAIVYGVTSDTAFHDVSVLSIDSLAIVTTMNQNFSLFVNVYDATLTPDDRFVYFCADTTMYLYSVNTVTRTITDTGYVSMPPNGGSAREFRLNDSGTFGVLLYEGTSGGNWLATALVNPTNGHLTWTGYTFAIDSIYAGGGSISDIQWVPIYTTSIPEELWRDPPPETELYSSQELPLLK